MVTGVSNFSWRAFSIAYILRPQTFIKRVSTLDCNRVSSDNYGEQMLISRRQNSFQIGAPKKK